MIIYPRSNSIADVMAAVALGEMLDAVHAWRAATGAERVEARRIAMPLVATEARRARREREEWVRLCAEWRKARTTLPHAAE